MFNYLESQRIHGFILDESEPPLLPLPLLHHAGGEHVLGGQLEVRGQTWMGVLAFSLAWDRLCYLLLCSMI